MKYVAAACILVIVTCVVAAQWFMPDGQTLPMSVLILPCGAVILAAQAFRMGPFRARGETEKPQDPPASTSRSLWMALRSVVAFGRWLVFFGAMLIAEQLIEAQWLVNGGHSQTSFALLRIGFVAGSALIFLISRYLTALGSDHPPR